MSRFIWKLAVFIFIGFLLGEGIVRVFHLCLDVPKFYQDKDGLIKYEPNQTGYYDNGNKWYINKYGQFGYETKSFDSLITVIGDSYIENMMNPPECHQASILSKLASNYNFYPCARSTASFLEYMEMKKSMILLKPILNLLYVHNGDFIESIREFNNYPHTFQLSVSTDETFYPELTMNHLKRIFYNTKIAYFLYRKYIVGSNTFTNNSYVTYSEEVYKKIDHLLNFTYKNYRTDNVILIFSPDCDERIIEIAKSNCFKIIKLETSDYKTWQLKNDFHWNCFGHEQAAIQVAKQLSGYLNL